MIDEFHAVPYYGDSKDLTEEHHMNNRKKLAETGLQYS